MFPLFFGRWKLTKNIKSSVKSYVDTTDFVFETKVIMKTSRGHLSRKVSVTGANLRVPKGVSMKVICLKAFPFNTLIYQLSLYSLGLSGQLFRIGPLYTGVLSI